MAILPHTGKEGGEVTAQRILSSARALGFSAEGHDLQISLSVGLSHFENENTMFFDSLVEAAERALDEAAARGGDRCAHQHPGPSRK
jgi:PleD family two-component response regulator